MVGRIATGSLALILVGYLAVGWWWDAEPAEFDVVERATKKANAQGHTAVTRYVMTQTAIAIGETLLEKRGGYLSNDVSPPGVVMDNVPAWEFGVLTQLRDTSTSVSDRLLALPEPKR